MKSLLAEVVCYRDSHSDLANIPSHFRSMQKSKCTWTENTLQTGHSDQNQRASREAEY